MKKWISPAVILLFSYLLLFHQLDRLPLRLWDESRNAVHAIEMHESGNMLVRTYDGQPDMYELKPPLLTWLQVLGLKTIGLDDLAIRLPSAIAGTVLAFLLFFFMKQRTSELFGLLASVLFLSAEGVLSVHLFRSGDHDALLTLWLTCTMVFSWRLVKNWNSLNIIFLVVFVGLAVFTKSIMGLAFAPAIVIWLLWQKKLVKLLSSSAFWLSLVMVSAALGVYYIQRENMSPGYLSEVNNNELFRRYLNTSESLSFNDETFWYYGIHLFDRFLAFWITIPLLIFLVIKKDKMGIFLGIFGLLFFLAISFGTKNFWYDGPLFPILALITSLGLYRVLSQVKPLIRYASAVAAIAFLVISAKHKTVVHENPAEAEFYSMAWELRDWRSADRNESGIIVMQGFDTHTKFYAKVLNINGSNLRYRKPFEVESGDTIWFAERAVRSEIEKKHQLIDLPSQSTRLSKALVQ